MKHTGRTDIPLLPIPEPLRGNEEGTWASSTIKQRLPAIGRQVLLGNQLDRSSILRIEALIQEIPTAPLTPIDDPGAPDLEDWNQALLPFIGQDWLQAPWFVVETYFYRRIIQAIRYFEMLSRGVRIDPFQAQKEKGLAAAQRAMEESCLPDLKRGTSSAGIELEELLLRVLWGNRADLSLWPVEGDPGQSDRHLVQGTERVLVDQRPEAAAYLSGLSTRPARADFVLDNAGVELMLDLCLVDSLLRTSTLEQVVLHLKLHPTFVSDATVADYQHSVESWQGSSVDFIHEFGSRLAQRQREGRIELSAEAFWTSPRSMWEMPEAIRRSLAGSQLVIVKGDANYRRLLGDRHWDHSAPFEDILSYFPAPLLVIRSLKAEVAAGLPPGIPARLDEVDEKWMTNGDWGVIHFVE